MPAWVLLSGGDFLWAASVYGTLPAMMGRLPRRTYSPYLLTPGEPQHFYRAVR